MRRLGLRPVAACPPGQAASHARAPGPQRRSPTRPGGPPRGRHPLLGPPDAAAPAESPTADKRPGQPSSPPVQPVYPEPGIWQQTLWRSFVAGGIGLHTGEVAYVRVRPAHAGEGRYFVRVPAGTNAGMYRPPEGEVEQVFPREELPLDEEAEDLRVRVYLQYLKAMEEDSFEGTFMEYCQLQTCTAENLAVKIDPESMPEEVRAWDGQEVIVPATIDHVSDGEHALSVSLGEGEHKVKGVEHLLSALEACGVDNARIEIEGGPEVPILDGSALGWVIEVQNAGLMAATCVRGGKVKRIRRAALRVQEEFMVRDGDSFVSVVPADRMTLTYGVNHTVVAPIIGRQWRTWCMQDDPNYKLELASARTYFTCEEEAFALRDAGFLQGGIEDVAIIANGEEWWDPGDIRYHDDEPVRHKLVDLIGDLSLLSLGGMGGLPYGHVMAYRADHELHLQFVRGLKERMQMQQGCYEAYTADPRAPADLHLDEVSKRTGKPVVEFIEED